MVKEADLRFPAWMDDVVARERARDAVAELVTALEALVASMGCIRCVEYVGMGPCPDHGEPLKDAEALLLRLKGTPTA